ncbi:hypothetical protein O0L34_g16032 [Tuta absoluta]|nr:hypothetical protein O0L34_g16032 [Tuta absoluta]
MFLVIYKSEARRRYQISALDCWSNQVVACYNKGERERNFRYTLPHLRQIGLKYRSLHFKTKIRAKFDSLEFQLGNVKKSKVRYLWLNLYEDVGDFKEFSRNMGYTLACDDEEESDCEQWASVNVTLNIYRSGAVMLYLGVNAASYYADSCASVKACLESFTIIKSSTRRAELIY